MEERAGEGPEEAAERLSHELDRGWRRREGELRELVRRIAQQEGQRGQAKVERLLAQWEQARLDYAERGNRAGAEFREELVQLTAHLDRLLEEARRGPAEPSPLSWWRRLLRFFRRKVV